MWCAILLTSAIATSQSPAQLVSELEAKVANYEARSGAASGGAMQLQNDVSGNKETIATQKKKIEQNQDLRTMHTDNLTATLEKQQELQAWRANNSELIDANVKVLDDEAHHLEETKKFVAENAASASENRAQLATAKGHTGELEKFVRTHGAEIEHNQEWMLDNKAMIEQNSRNMVKAEQLLETTQVFLHQNTATIHQNYAAAQKNTAALQAQAVRLTNADSDVKISKDAVGQNSQWMEVNRGRVEENARFIEKNQEFLAVHENKMSKNRDSIGANAGKLGEVSETTTQLGAWVEGNRETISQNRQFIDANREEATRNRKWVEDNAGFITENKENVGHVTQSLDGAQQAMLHNHELVGQLFSVWDEIENRIAIDHA